jgi:hypothetical protein
MQFRAIDVLIYPSDLGYRCVDISERSGYGHGIQFRAIVALTYPSDLVYNSAFDVLIYPSYLVIYLSLLLFTGTEYNSAFDVLIYPSDLVFFT